MKCNFCRGEMTLAREIDDLNSTDPHTLEIWLCYKCRNDRKLRRVYLYDVGHFFKICDDRRARLKIEVRK
jgi:hypothetical protein